MVTKYVERADGRIARYKRSQEKIWLLVIVMFEQMYYSNVTIQHVRAGFPEICHSSAQELNSYTPRMVVLGEPISGVLHGNILAEKCQHP